VLAGGLSQTRLKAKIDTTAIVSYKRSTMMVTKTRRAHAFVPHRQNHRAYNLTGAANQQNGAKSTVVAIRFHGGLLWSKARVVPANESRAKVTQQDNSRPSRISRQSDLWTASLTCTSPIGGRTTR